MILRWDLLIIITTTLLWKTCLCDHECSITFSNSTEMVLTCLSNMTYEELPLYNYTTNQLANITSIVVNGLNGSLSGPFTSIPPNICLLPNLKSIDLSNNQIRTVDPADSFRTCFTNVTDLDVSYNNITNFPSPMIYNMQNLQNLDFQHNQLTDVPGYAFQNISNMETLDFSYNSLTTFELWALLVMKTADFRHNQISMITNKYFYQMPNITSIGIKEIFLGDNPSTNLTDAVYEMYNACGEVYDFLLAEDNDNLYIPSLTYNLAFVNFGTVQIDCSCQQSYILQMLGTIAPASNDSIQFPIANSTCNASNIRFEVSSCPNGRNPVNSSVDFSRIYPRFCKINSNESGSIMSVPSATIPTANVPKYPHYLTEFMNPGACFFAFSDSISVRIRCTIDVSSSSTLPSNASFNEYLSNVTTIDFASKISSLPSYLCSLPSREIDLSYQSFTTLTDATFPCLDWFHTIRMTHNSLTSVNMTSRNFSNLTTLDLSSNQLTGLPHSILTPTPTSLRVLNLSNNSITSIDIFLYTLKNITVDLSNNPINSSSIINPQNVTFSSGNNTNPSVTIIFPSSVTNSTFILNDATALTVGTCNSGAVLDYRNTLLSTYTNVLLDCTCASINLKIIFERNNASISNDFSCANLTSGSTYRNLTFASCGSNALDFSTGLCYNESLQYLHPTICSTDITNSTHLILTCPFGTNLTELPFPTNDIPALHRITSFEARGENNTRGPFSTIPSNICWMSNLTTLDLSYNQFGNTLIIPNSINCTLAWQTIDLSDNNLVTFPTNLFRLQEFNSVDLSNNQLTTMDLIMSARVHKQLDLRNNSITSVINPTSYMISTALSTGDADVFLDGNPIMDITDTLYEMYGSCTEIVEFIYLDDPQSPPPLTKSFIKMNFGSTKTIISNQNTTECSLTFSIGNTNLLITCTSNSSVRLLPINQYPLSTLNSVRTLKIEGINNAGGPMDTLPPNICFLPNLLELNISYNRLDHLDSSFFSSNPSCLRNLQTLDIGHNLLTEFPSEFLTKTPNLQALSLQGNQLTSLDLASTVLVGTSINLSNNKISKITNDANIDMSTYTNPFYTAIDLTNNSAIINLSDTIYEMYGACYEVQRALNSSLPSKTPVLTISFLNINFDASKINCSCNQYYFQRSLLSTFDGNRLSSAPLSNTMCTDGTLLYNNTNMLSCSTSSAIFNTTIPHLCTINQNNSTLIYTNTTDNTTDIYPYYMTQSQNNTYCVYTFYSNGVKVSIDCLNGSDSLTEISTAVLTNKYFSNITQVIVNNQSSISKLPNYLCILPSTTIDLSNQLFSILSSDTFPCSVYSTLQNINLADNRISVVNLTYVNWTLFDLSSNNLTQLPYSLLSLNQSTTSVRQILIRTLDVSSNQILQLDLFAYTYPSTVISIENNPFSRMTNGYHLIKNYQRQSLRSGPVSSSVNLPTQMRFLINDQLAQNYNTCDSQTLIYLINILQYMKNNETTIEIECSCSSIYLKEYLNLYNSSDKLTTRFSCSNTSSLNTTQFDSLTETNCLNNISLSSDRLCQFTRLTGDSLATTPLSSDNGRLLAIILGSILGSIGFIALIAILLFCLCRKRKDSTQKSNMTVLARPPIGGDNSRDNYATARSLPSSYHLTSPGGRPSPDSEHLHDIGEYTLNRQAPVYIRDSMDSLQQDIFDQRERNRQLRQPPIDYDTSRNFRHLGNSSPTSSFI
ncbi:hypothetical protein I4U23_028120 [Adineta vaga]|nr:hypothetical protein I4U23_028120 [Adineta vaga]